MVTLPTMHSTQPSTQKMFNRSLSSQCANTALRARKQDRNHKFPSYIAAPTLGYLIC